MTTSSRTTHHVPTPDGRTLVVDVTGPEDGPTTLFLHSAPGSRSFDPDPQATAGAGCRLVTFDRAGYGGSTALPTRSIPTVLGHAADAALVVEALEAGPVDVVGWSAGGRIAAALAATRPELVRSVAVIGTPAPDAEVPWVPEEHRAVSARLRQDPGSAYAALLDAFAPLGAAVAQDDEVAAGQVGGGPADEALLAARPELRAAAIAMVRSGFAPGVAGVAADIVADQVADWGFDHAAITAPTTCWYGAEDPIVGPAHGSWWADGIRGARLTVVPQAGHLVVAAAWAAVLGARP
ncbi:alpha/beta hydrolase [Aquihabitans sp. G128]|uniref:alpha/beta fold hydrolase n=1 Tax=Aquihabitans sp. G128 TaxID=2849779 RepID=UPI001C23B7F9|nr:alpha/beta hydrolase [Aquihabitans sp. G128]QXC63220.1 alpha/beta hydrolase [Aquihabitans sp. G128]